MATAASSDTRLSVALRRRPDIVWIRDYLALLGWGDQLRIEPGTGPGRYQQALELARAHNSVVFASFTFDEEQEGSIVILPETTMRVDSSEQTVLRGQVSSLPPAAEFDEIPAGSRAEVDRAGWDRDFALAMKRIHIGDLEKVVLSRAVDVRFTGRVPIHPVIENLVTAEPSSHTYAVAGLVGSSPELLVQLRAGSVRSVSLAGSADRTKPGSITSLSTPKSSAEHAFAADSVEDALAAHCETLSRHNSQIATFGNIHHLATSFKGTIKAGIAVTDLLASLHPTAAVAGTPTEVAMELIREIERHDRGRYAGPVGWVDPAGEGEFAIALRSGELGDESVRLFAGAGLVDGSEADAEYEETEIKLRPMANALGLT